MAPSDQDHDPESGGPSQRLQLGDRLCVGHRNVARKLREQKAAPEGEDPSVVCGQRRLGEVGLEIGLFKEDRCVCVSCKVSS